MSMKKDAIEELFTSLEHTFDIAEPENDHQARFMEKLQKSGVKPLRIAKKNKAWYWKPLSIAASIAILVVFGLKLINNSVPNVSPEVEKTQFYFASLLNEEIEKLNTIADDDTKILVNDVMQQLTKLQEDYTLLEQELVKHGDHKKILYAMIINFQTRINLLQEVIHQIEEAKKLKTSNTNFYENSSI
ncbi:hypothetical protein [Ascidiimonas sp. W6]|uniref:hypothetical protein n=1 Tax=Ascidiimonas meishanensis TaxID=3128903 RepID=UPI0030EC4B30